MSLHHVFLNYCFDKNRLKSLITWSLLTAGERKTISIVESLKELGFRFATKAGISLGLDDLKIPPEKLSLISQAKEQVEGTQREYRRGYLTTIEKSQHLIDTWHRTSETLKQTVVNNFQLTDRLSPVYMMAFSGARGNISQVRQLAGMRGLMADPQGQIIGFPIRSNFREGLTLTEYMISCYGARKGLVDTALRTADAGYLTRRLVDVSQHMIVKTATCATSKGIVLKDLEASGKTILPLRDRLIGRVLAQDVLTIDGGGSLPPPTEAIDHKEPYLPDGNASEGTALGPHTLDRPRQGGGRPLGALPGTKSTLGWRRGAGPPQAAPSSHLSADAASIVASGNPGIGNPRGHLIGSRNEEISIGLASKIAASHQQVSVRSPLTCSLRHGVCQLCYGWSLSEGRLVTLGEAVGIIAAQSIGEPGTQLTMRTFHTGGVFSGDVMAEIRAPYDGIVNFPRPLQGLLIRTSHGKVAFLTKTAGRLLLARAGKPPLVEGRATRTTGVLQQGEGKGEAGSGGPPRRPSLWRRRGGAASGRLRPTNPQQISYGLGGVNREAEGLKKDPRERDGITDASFSLEAATVLFVRQGERVRQAQLIAEFSSMGTEVNETIEAKRTLFSEMAGQIFFANMAMGTHLKGNGEILQISKDLGSIWVLSGKQSISAPLLDVYTKGSHLVSRDSLVTRISRRTNGQSFPATRTRSQALFPSLTGNDYQIPRQTAPLGRSFEISSRTRGSQATQCLLQSIGDGQNNCRLLKETPGISRLEDGLMLSREWKNDLAIGMSFPQSPSRKRRVTAWDRPIEPLTSDAELLARDQGSPFSNRQTSFRLPDTSKTDAGDRPRNPVPDGQSILWQGTLSAGTGRHYLVLAAENGSVKADRTRFPHLFIDPIFLLKGRSNSQGRYRKKGLGKATSTIAFEDWGGTVGSTQRGTHLSRVRCFSRASLRKATICWFPSTHKSSRGGFAWIDSRYVNQRFVSGEMFWIDEEALVCNLSCNENLPSQFLSRNTNCIASEANEGKEALLLRAAEPRVGHGSANQGPITDQASENAPNAAYYAPYENPASSPINTAQRSRGLDHNRDGIPLSLPSSPQQFERWAWRGGALLGERNRQGRMGKQFLSPIGWAKRDYGSSYRAYAPALQSLQDFSPSSSALSPPWRGVTNEPLAKEGRERERYSKLGIGQRRLLLFEKGKAVTLQRRNFHTGGPPRKAFLNQDGSLLFTPAYYRKSNAIGKVTDPSSQALQERPAASVQSSIKQNGLNPLSGGRLAWNLSPPQTREFFQSWFLPFEMGTEAHLGMRVQTTKSGIPGGGRGAAPPPPADLLGCGRRSEGAVEKHVGQAELVTVLLRGVRGAAPPPPVEASGSRSVPTRLVKRLAKKLTAATPLLEDGTELSNGNEECLATLRLKTGWTYYPQDNAKLTTCHQSMQYNDRSGLDDLVFDPVSVYFDAFRSSPFSYCLANRTHHSSFKLEILQRRRLTLDARQRGNGFQAGDGRPPRHPLGNTSSMFEHIMGQHSSDRGLSDVSISGGNKTKQHRAWEAKGGAASGRPAAPFRSTMRFASPMVPCGKGRGLESQLERDLLLFFRKLVWLAQSPVGTPNLRLGTEKRSFNEAEDNFRWAKTEKFQFLFCKDLANHESFLWLRSFPLQQQVVANRKARHLIAFPAHASFANASAVAHGSQIPRRGGVVFRTSQRGALDPFVEGKSGIAANMIGRGGGATPRLPPLDDKENSTTLSSRPHQVLGWSKGQGAPMNGRALATAGGSIFPPVWARGLPPARRFGEVVPIQWSGVPWLPLSSAKTGRGRLRPPQAGPPQAGPPQAGPPQAIEAIEEGAVLSSGGPDGNKEWYQRLYNWRHYLFASDSARPSLTALIRRAHPHSLETITKGKSRFLRSLNHVSMISEVLLRGSGQLFWLKNHSRQGVKWREGEGLSPQLASANQGISGGLRRPRRPLDGLRRPRLRQSDGWRGGAASGRLKPTNPPRGGPSPQISFKFCNKQLPTRTVSKSPTIAFANTPLLACNGFQTTSVSKPTQLARFALRFPVSPSQLPQRPGIEIPGIDIAHNMPLLGTSSVPCESWQPTSPLPLMSQQAGEMISQHLCNPQVTRADLLDVTNASPYGSRMPLLTRQPATAATLLTEADHVSLSVNQDLTAHLMPGYQRSVGQFVNLGEDIAFGQSAPFSGQIVSIEREKIALRRTQALLFYAQGAMHVNHGEWIDKNAPILTLTYQKLVTGDIVQGIPKIEQFFEAPATKEGEPLHNSLQAKLRRTFQRLKVLLPLAQAAKRSFDEIQQVLVEGILKVYLSQGVRIADKHLEIVIRQMTSKGHVLDVGNTGLFQGEHVNLDRIERINLATYGQKADYEPAVLGITQASLDSDSFISAASFQETTRVLSRDTVVGKTDFLRGLKERVVLGDLIQAGTGLDDNINYGLLLNVRVPTTPPGWNKNRVRSLRAHR